MHIRLYTQNIWGDFPASEKIANRNELIASLVRQYEPDVCHFQECNPSTSRAAGCNIASLLADTYAEASAENAGRNFTPVFYRKDRFEEVESGFVPYEGLNDMYSKSITWVILREKESGKLLATASTHFWWKHDGEADSLARIANAQKLAGVCETIRTKYGIPVVTSGDLNCGPCSAQGMDGYNELVRLGLRDARYLAEKTTDMHTHHEYPVLNEEGNYVNGKMPVRTLDHVFACGDPVKVHSFAVVTEQNALDSSDHCPLVTDYEV